jgi:hypothetical protein
MGGEETVSLTAKEHFICHALLVRMTKGSDHHKMVFAFNMMGVDAHGKRYVSRLHEYNRVKVAKVISESNKGRQPRLGAVLSDETKKKIGDAHRGKVPSKELRELWSKQRTGAGNGNYGKKHSEERKRKIGQKSKDRQYPVSCVHCQKTVSNQLTLSRHHGDRCKSIQLRQTG